jgi:L-fuculose-phosphate aldolase
LGSASVVLLRNNGALCCGRTRDDALAAAIVTEKNCNSLISAALFGEVKTISHFESRLMRLIYTKKYSKLASAK